MPSMSCPETLFKRIHYVTPLTDELGNWQKVEEETELL